MGGRPVLRLEVAFTIRDAEGTVFPCSSHSFTVLAHPLAFSIGVSCAASGEYFRPHDLAFVAQSIRVRVRR